VAVSGDEAVWRDLLLVSYYKAFGSPGSSASEFPPTPSRPFRYNRAYARILMPTLRVLISAEQIRNRIQEMAAEIDRDYPDGEPVYLIGILKGAFIFLADLARAMQTPARVEFIGISSYGKGQSSSGEVKLTKDLDVTVEGHHVILVEDIVDTGITLNYLLKLMTQRKPKSVRIATLLDKPERRQTAVHVNYAGFQIPDEFVVGYGLDYAEDYRNLKDVCVLGQ
jgi:hypoxanthine phosphoribosyltransferase